MKKRPIPEFNDKDWFHICKWISWQTDDRIETDCWLWSGCTDGKGYGLVWLSNGISYRVHRVICAWNFGDHPELDAGHAFHEICGNTNCLAPHHVSWQTHADNTHQRKIDGTDNSGERNGNVKLTISEVEEIKEKYATGKYTKTALGKEYGVDHSTIGRYINGKLRNNG